MGHTMRVSSTPGGGERPGLTRVAWLGALRVPVDALRMRGGVPGVAPPWRGQGTRGCAPLHAKRPFARLIHVLGCASAVVLFLWAQGGGSEKRGKEQKEHQGEGGGAPPQEQHKGTGGWCLHDWHAEGCFGHPMAPTAKRNSTWPHAGRPVLGTAETHTAKWPCACVLIAAAPPGAPAACTWLAGPALAFLQCWFQMEVAINADMHTMHTTHMSQSTKNLWSYVTRMWTKNLWSYVTPKAMPSGSQPWVARRFLGWVPRFAVEAAVGPTPGCPVALAQPTLVWT